MIRKTGMFVFLACLLAGCDNAKDLPLLGRYVAKNVCASLWLEGYEQGAAVGYVTNVAPLIQPSWKVTLEPGQVRVNSFWFPWLSTKTARHLTDTTSVDCRNEYGATPLPSATYSAPAVPATGFVDQTNPDSALQRYLDSVIAVGAPEHTTAMLVLYGNQVIAEAYRDGLGPDSPLKGFSMSKSFANLLVGRLAMQSQLAVQDALLLPGWELDQRAAITWDSSLRMSSGLLWNEASLGDNNDQGQMFYNTADPAAYAAIKPYARELNTTFNYSSGDYMNIASALVRQEQWFDPGWNLDENFVLEFSPDGETPLLGEGVYLTTRGWAALASLYMHEGELNGEPVLSPQWVAYSLTPSVTNYDYGAGIWLNLGQNLFPSLTPDTFAFAGSFDRYVVAVPSRDVVIVRFGFSAQPGDFDMERFVANVLELVPY
ncbi:MAG: serine hydrolase [Ketobacter sp.]